MRIKNFKYTIISDAEIKYCIPLKILNIEEYNVNNKLGIYYKTNLNGIYTDTRKSFKTTISVDTSEYDLIINYKGIYYGINKKDLEDINLKIELIEKLFLKIKYEMRSEIYEKFFNEKIFNLSLIEIEEIFLDAKNYEQKIIEGQLKIDDEIKTSDGYHQILLKNENIEPKIVLHRINKNLVKLNEILF